MSPAATLEIAPVTPERWPDLAELFATDRESAGCSCMWFRVPPKVFTANGSDGNRAAMEEIVAADEVPGLLAYEAGRPVGWISLAPRRQFPRIQTSAGGVVTEEAVWSVVCFLIAPGRRGEGVASALLSAAVGFARDHGAKVLEAYPIERDSRISNADAYTGPRSMYERAGFRETGRFDRWAAVPAASGPDAKRLVRPPGRPVMRLAL